MTDSRMGSSLQNIHGVKPVGAGPTLGAQGDSSIFSRWKLLSSPGWAAAAVSALPALALLLLKQKQPVLFWSYSWSTDSVRVGGNSSALPNLAPFNVFGDLNNSYNIFLILNVVLMVAKNIFCSAVIVPIEPCHEFHLQLWQWMLVCWYL